MPKIRNILIFIAIAAVLILMYVFFVKQPSNDDQSGLISSTGVNTTPNTSGSGGSTSVPDNTDTQNILTLLLSVKTIKLNTDIFADPAFASLHDSSITLTPDAVVGRPNPFAQFGTQQAITTPTATTTTTVTTPPTTTDNTTNNQTTTTTPPTTPNP